VNLSRNATLKIQFILDELIPPVIRDSKWFMWFPFRFLFGEKASYFLEFKAKAHSMTELEFAEVYRQTASVHLDRESDINSECEARILSSIAGDSVLDIACGRGYLSKKLSANYKVTGADIIVPEKLIQECPEIDFHEIFVESLPFEDHEFDTVVSAHTLEHVIDPGLAIRELRRVCKRRLIVIVPRQRPYRYTFDLHLNFFPNRYDLVRLIDPKNENYACINCGGDWFYVEDIE
jgi:ubiquinone/menaquinone biosynthesis C-methylase UbiE